VLRSWHRFIAVLIAFTALLLIAAAAFVAVIDPYDSLAFSPHWTRHRVTSSGRYIFPGLIRHRDLDSAVFGTSTIMMLRPEELNRTLGGRFANLAISAGTAWEQTQLMRFFASHAREPIRTIIVGIDQVWCEPSQATARLTEHPFPIWEYDDNPWNDYANLLNTRAIAHAAMQLAMIAGLRRPPYPDDGYLHFMPDDQSYDLDRARQHIYASPNQPRAADLVLPDPGPRPADWIYPDLALLGGALDRFPKESRIILMVMPAHLARFADTKNWATQVYCKAAAVELARQRTNVTVVDFMLPDRLTRDDSAYWDSVHFRIGRVPELVEALGSVVKNKSTNGDIFKVLWPR
jgi:hypothetical protein